MQAPNPSNRGTENEVPKENARRQSGPPPPPPAYTPRRQQDLSTLTARVIRSAQNQQSRRATSPNMVHQQPLFTTLLTGDMGDMEESDEHLSPISLRITTSINVSSNNNLVCLGAPPAEHANSIAQAVVQAMQQNSSGQCGIPMIDEEGCPRPIKIEVDAGMMVEGSGNVIGTPDIIQEVLRQRGIRHQHEQQDEDMEEAGPSKRRCSSQ